MNPIYIFIQPPSLEELELRLKKRGTEEEIQIQERLRIAKRELEFADLPGVFDVKIVNADLDFAYKQLKQAIFG
ncbi:hypothetical protein LOD99_16006 [Oopsacas minuta]|uniref:Guanylate kinase-like domain-containing protein n=1 Tax=Oopsacas minuta TaxID=111878 RepID=A0AAV7K5Z5_9METZ|nr:hypothetical protein LOD99_16006 [Oopsacas minuta]